ncbi:MAG: Bax inhibitor-1/YccA family protein [Parachlamydiales bacterium]|jgi:uncharacterized YccA/Bax inhibitor family protein
MMRSANPALGDDTFRAVGNINSRNEAMTVQGVVYKTALLLLLVVLSAGWTWMHFVNAGSDVSSVSSLMMIGAIGGLVVAVVTVFKKEWAAYTAPIYALLEGLFIGGISAVFNASYPGIALQAAALTFGTLFAMLALYQAGIVRATESFKMGVFAATGGIAIVYLASMALGFFGISIPGIFGNGLVGIGFSLFVVAIAALNLVIDFDFIEQGTAARAPKYMEWYGAFAMMVTLVWLYIEILRLLSKLRDR